MRQSPPVAAIARSNTLIRTLRRLATSLLAVGLILSTPGMASRAEAQPMDFDIPAGDVAASLATWSKTSGIGLDVQLAFTNGGRTKAVRGRMEPRAALDLLLADTPLDIIADVGNVIFVGRDMSPHLDSEFDDWYADNAYEQAIRRVFQPVFAPTIVMRLIVSPTFTGPSALGLKLDGGHYSIVHIARLPRELAGPLSDLGAGLSTSLPDIRPPVCEVSLDSGLGARIAKAGQAVMRVRNFTEVITDGTYYDFTFRDGATELRRNIQMPDDKLVDGSLGAVADAMADYCEHPTLKTTRISAELKALEAALKKAPR